MDLSEAVTDPDMAESFVILRATGQFGLGGWQQNAPVAIPGFGVVSIAKAQDMEMIPEGDRISGSIVIHSTQELLLTNEDTNQMADQVVWMGDVYRVYASGDYGNRNFFTALAARKKGN